jgi:hypothetical protein
LQPDDFCGAALEGSFFEYSSIGKDNCPDILYKNFQFAWGKTPSIENLEKLFIKFAGKLTNELPIITSFIQTSSSLFPYAIEKYHCFITAVIVPLLVRAAEPLGFVRHPCHKMDD